MSNYQDDTIETAVAADSNWLNTGALVVESAKAVALAFMTLGLLVSEQAQASDIEYGSSGTMVIETAQAEELLYLSHVAIQQTNETARLKDEVFHFLHDQVLETAQLVDIDLGKTESWVYESATVQDSNLSQRTAYQVVYDTAIISDSAFAYALDDIEEVATFTDSDYGTLLASSLVIDTAQFEDSDLSQYVSVQYVNEQAKLSDSAFGTLHASTLTQETAYLEDEVLTDLLLGQAWICNSKTWAMSRYSPFGFEGLVVINGKVHLYNDQGVYVMQGSGENIKATLETGALDFGEQLTHPTAAYFEYQLSGLNKAIDMHVSTTQSGTKQSYQYIMPSETAEHLTNGRILFGRGLRGRHFGFKINIQAQSAQINALSIEHTQTRRRV